MLNSDEIDELDDTDHRIISNNHRSESLSKHPDDFKSSSEGLSEHEIHILVENEFIPNTTITNKNVHQKTFPIKFHNKSCSELPHKTIKPTTEDTLKISNDDHLITTEQLLQQKQYENALNSFQKADSIIVSSLNNKSNLCLR